VTAPEKDPDPWLSVADVAAELGYTRRQAWHTIQALGVPIVCAVKDRINGARFRRSDWQAALERAKAPPPVPVPSGRAPRGGRRAAAAAPAAAARGDLGSWRQLAKGKGAGR